MKPLIFCCIMVALAAVLWAQGRAGSNPSPAASSSASIPAQESSLPATDGSSEIFRLASSADFIAVGTVTEIKGTGRRLTEQEARELEDLSKANGGMVYSFRVEKLICAQTDFKPGVERPTMEGKNLLIFHNLDEPVTEYEGTDTPVKKREKYQLKQQYLLLLRALPEQEQLTRKYNLDGGQTYYTAFEGEKGLIPLPADDSSLSKSLVEFCEALSPAEAQQKLARLNVLMHVASPELRSSAKEAIRAIEQNALRP
jgi:hypothetical protein